MNVRNRTRTTKWNLFFHLVSILIALTSGVLLVPLYLKYISLDLYGAWLATGNIVMWLTAIDPGLSSVLQQRVGMAYGKGDWVEVQSFLWSGMVINACLIFVILIFGIIASFYIPEWINLKSTSNHSVLIQAFQISVVGTGLVVFSYAITAVNQGLQSSLGIGIVYVIVNIASIVVTIMLLKNWGLLAIPLGNLIRGGGMVIGNTIYLTWRFLSEKVVFSFKFNQLMQLIKLTTYTFLARAGSVIANNIDSFIVGRIIGLSYVPVLALTRKGPELSRMFVERPAVAIMPAISHLVGAGEIEKARAVLVRLMSLICWLLALIAGGFIAFNDDFVRLWVGSKLYAGFKINSIIVLSVVIGVITLSFSNLCLSLGNIKGSSIAGFIQNALFIPLIIFGARYLGLLGVVLAPVISMVSVSFWYFPLSFFKQLKITSTDYLRIIGDWIRSFGIASVLTTGFYFFKVSGWLGFLLGIVVYSLLFFICLFMISKMFRLESLRVGKRLKSIFRIC